MSVPVRSGFAPRLLYIDTSSDGGWSVPYQTIAEPYMTVSVASVLRHQRGKIREAGCDVMLLYRQCRPVLADRRITWLDDIAEAAPQ